METKIILKGIRCYHNGNIIVVFDVFDPTQMFKFWDAVLHTIVWSGNILYTVHRCIGR